MDKIKEREELIREIERYFECLLSDEEEAVLRDRLTHTDVIHPGVEEAKALMGFRTIGYGNDPEEEKVYAIRRNTARRVFRGIAASLLLMIGGAGIISIFYSPQSRNECRAYINGRYITDDEAVLALLAENIEEFNAGLSLAKEDLMKDMENFEPMAECIESDFSPEDI